ncbi:hypothetical protein EDD85DRAFT_797179 [Armillaria nabsnona]|nr:hypothetical protein EDD85DRAFT_797179 [Armillaria nabsnona]
MMWSALASVTWNPITTLHVLIKSIHSSSLCRETFAQAELGSLQLLQDVDVQWSSTDIMIEVKSNDVIEAGLTKLEDYFLKVMHIPAYNFTMILNPKMKLCWYEQYDPLKLVWVKNLFMQELWRYSSVPPAANAIPSPTCDWTDEILGFDVPRSSSQTTLEQEFNAYLLDQQVLSSLLLFWQENRICYSTMFLMAMDILPIQGSSVPSLNFTWQYDKEVQTAALEAMLDDETAVPTEINEFKKPVTWQKSMTWSRAEPESLDLEPF